MQPPIVRCSAVQGGSRPRTSSQPKKPLGPSRGSSGQPGPELPLWGGGSSHPWSSATAHCAPPPTSSPAAPVCGWSLRRTDTASPARNHTHLGEGGCWEKAPPASARSPAGRGIARIYWYWVDSTVSGPSQFLQGLPREAGGPSPLGVPCPSCGDIPATRCSWGPLHPSAEV